MGAESVMQRLNAGVPGGWRQQLQALPAELVPGRVENPAAKDLRDHQPSLFAVHA